MEARRGTGSRLLNTLANAILDRALPRVRAFLRDRVGEGANLEAMRMDGARVHLDGARIPLGERVVLTVERATLRVAPEGAARGAPLRLDDLDGRVSVLGHGQSRFEATLTFEGQEAAVAPDVWAQGELRVHEATWTPAGPHALEGRATVRVTGDRWRLDAGALRAGPARVEVSAEGELERGVGAVVDARIGVRDAGIGALVDALGALGGRDLSLARALPPAARASGELSWARGTGARVDLWLRGEGSELRVELECDPDGGVGAGRVEGHLGGDDAPFGGTLARFADGPVRARVDVALSGRLPRPDVEARVELDPVPTRLLATPVGMEASASRAGDGPWVVSVDARAAISSVRASGRVTSEGAIEASLEGFVDPVELLRSAAFPAALDPAPSAPLSLTGAVAGSLRAPTLELGLRGERVALRLGERRFIPPAELAAVAAHAAVSTERASWSVTARAGDAELRGAGERARGGDPAPLATVEVGALAAPWLARLASAFGLRDSIRLASAHPTGAGGLRIPDDARGRGRVVFDGAGDSSGELSAWTASSRLHCELSVRGGRLDGTRVGGRLSLSDALRAGLLPGRLTSDGRGEIDLDLEVEGTTASWSAAGPLRAARAWAVVVDAPALPPQALEDVRGQLRIDATQVEVTDVEARAWGGALRARGWAPLGESERADPRAAVEVLGASVALGEAASRFLGGLPVRAAHAGPRSRDERLLPGDARIDAELEWSVDDRFDGSARLRTPRGSELCLDLRVSPSRSLDGSRVRGRVVMADAITFGLPPLPVRVGSEGELGVDVSAEGGPRSWRWSGTATATAVHLRLGPAELESVFVVDELTSHVALTSDRAEWTDLLARAYDGRLRSAGVVGWTDAWTGLRSRSAWEEVDVARLPAGGGRLGAHATGRCTGALEVEREGPPTGPSAGVGWLEIERPTYPAVARTAEALRRWGLPPPGATGSGPLRASLRLGPTKWHLEDVSLAVDAGRARGRIHVGFDGSLAGRLEIAVQPAYLSRSSALALPAAVTGTVTIPVALGGRLAAPSFDADLVGALGNVLVDNPIGALFSDAMEGLVTALGGSPTRPPARPSTPEPSRSASGPRPTPRADAAEMDAVLDAILDDAPEADALLDRLMDAGMAPDELAERLERRRAARRRR